MSLNQINIRKRKESKEISKGKTLPNLNITTLEVVRAKAIVAAEKG
jgi:hypothetical protein